MSEKSLVQEFYDMNGRFPNDEETLELVDYMVDDFRDRRFMRLVSEMFDREYPRRVHYAWMIGSLKDRHESPIIVHSSDITDTMERMYFDHKVLELAGEGKDVMTISLLRAIRNSLAVNLAEEHTPILFYKCEDAHEPEIRKSRFSDELPEDLTELLKMLYPKENDLKRGNIDDALDSMRDGFFKANGFIPTEAECVRIVDDVREEIRKEKEWEEEVKRKKRQSNDD